MAFSQPTTLTWAQAKARVAQVAGSQNDADQLIQAGYALEEAIRYWENYRDWKYSLISTLYVLTSGDYAIDLEPAFKKIYSVRITGSTGRTLHEVPKRVYDAVLPTHDIVYPTGTYPTNYYIQTGNLSPGVIVLLPTSSIAATFEVSYFARSTVPAGITDGTTTDDATVLDFPEKFDYALLSLARMFYLMYKGGEDKRLELITSLAQENLKKCRGEDEWNTDLIAGFTPPPNQTYPMDHTGLPWGDW